MKVASIKDLLTKYSLSPNKRLGQNFLVSGSAASRIVEEAVKLARVGFLEIGPGLGAITEGLAGSGLPVTAVEIDSGLCRCLADRFSGLQNFTLVHSDYLKADIRAPFDVAVSNLPYYCSSEILFRLAADHRPPFILAMLQKEMAQRLMSKPGSEEYGAFTVNMGLYYSTEILFEAGGSDFYPPPDVKSVFIKMTSLDDNPLSERGREVFHMIVRSAFWGRRKTIYRSLKDSPHTGEAAHVIERVLEEAAVDRGIRGEELSPGKFIEMADIWARLTEKD
jgi:16S rRNA (adenine1518-N6/adenine1519-N6)-dimethyltransferase